MYILSKQRNGDLHDSFRLYREYLQLNHEGFPKSAFKLANSDWYFDPNESKCPHDGWLERLTISEASTGERQEARKMEINVMLLGAWHDGNIHFHYTNATSYLLDSLSKKGQHGDWLYDEFRVGSTGSVIHEIEWANGHWVIEAEDVNYSWEPAVNSQLHASSNRKD